MSTPPLLGDLPRSALPGSSTAFRRSPVVSLRVTTVAMACALTFAGVAGCAAAAPYNPSELAPDQLTSVGDICQSVIRVQPIDADYAACVESLSGSVRNVEHSRAMQQAHQACSDQALRPGSPDLAVCELQAAGARPGAPADLTFRNVAAAPSWSKSYQYASPSEVFSRAQMSCARLGLDPASYAFAQCVADLQASLFDADNPMQ
jgi:hypothetical protein